MVLRRILAFHGIAEQTRSDFLSPADIILGGVRGGSMIFRERLFLHKRKYVLKTTYGGLSTLFLK